MINMTSKSNYTRDFLNILHARKSVRHFTGKAVTREQLEVLLKAGMAAPSGRNEQPWVFIAITERTVLDQLADDLPTAGMLHQAGCAVVVCADISLPIPEGKVRLWTQDCSAATENILLAAEAMNLGAVWTAVHPYPDRQNPVRKILQLPETIVPFSVIPVGYPTGEDQPKNKYDIRKIHWEKW